MSNHINLCAEFKIFVSGPEQSSFLQTTPLQSHGDFMSNADRIQFIMDWFDVEGERFDGITQSSFAVSSFGAESLSRRGRQKVKQFCKAIYGGGVTFSGVQASVLNELGRS